MGYPHRKRKSLWLACPQEDGVELIPWGKERPLGRGTYLPCPREFLTAEERMQEKGIAEGETRRTEARAQVVAALRAVLEKDLEPEVESASVLLVFPRRMALQKRLLLPVVKGRQFLQALNFAATDSLALPLSELCYAYVLGPRNEGGLQAVFLWALPRAQVEAWTELVAEAGGTVTGVTLAVPSLLLAASGETDDFFTLYLGERESELALFQGGKPTFSRAVPRGWRELRLQAPMKDKEETGWQRLAQEAALFRASLSREEEGRPLPERLRLFWPAGGQPPAAGLALLREALQVAIEIEASPPSLIERLGHLPPSRRLDLRPPQVKEEESKVRQVERCRRWLALGGVGALLLAGLWFAANLGQTRRLQTLKEEYAALAPRLALARARQQEANRQNRENKAGEMVLRTRPDWLTLWGELSLAAPSGIWLTRFSGQDGKPLEVTGLALAQTDLARFLNLLAERGFQQVNLIYARESRVGEIPVVSFALTVATPGGLGFSFSGNGR